MIWQGVPFGFARENGKLPLTYTGDAPVLVFGPPGSSKTVGFVMNQLLDDVSPAAMAMLASDPLGEAAEDTGKVGRLLSAFDIRAAPAAAWERSAGS